MLNINGYPNYTALKRVMATLAEAKKQQEHASGPAAQNTKNLEPMQNIPGAFVRDADHYKSRG